MWNEDEMLKVSYWVKGSRERNTEAINYVDALAEVSNAQDIYYSEAGHYLDKLKERMQDDEECGLEYLVEKLEKINPKTRICEIVSWDGESVYFVVKGFEDKKISDDFYKTILSSNAFWDWFSFHNITINGKQIEPACNGVERLY